MAKDEITALEKALADDPPRALALQRLKGSAQIIVAAQQLGHLDDDLFRQRPLEMNGRKVKGFQSGLVDRWQDIDDEVRYWRNGDARNDAEMVGLNFSKWRELLSKLCSQKRKPRKVIIDDYVSSKLMALPNRATVCYLALTKIAGGKHSFRATMTELARLAARNERTIIRAIDDLENTKLIEVQRARSRGGSFFRFI